MFFRRYGHFSPPSIILSNSIFQSQSFGWGVVFVVSTPALLLAFCVHNDNLYDLWFAWNSIMFYVWRFVFLSMQSLDTWCLTTRTSCHVRTALYWVITQQVVVISYQHFGTMILEGFLNPEDGTDKLSQNAGKNCCYSMCNNPEELSSYLLCGRSLK